MSDADLAAVDAIVRALGLRVTADERDVLARLLPVVREMADRVGMAAPSPEAAEPS